MPRVLVSWSSGKDSAWTLHMLRQQRGVEIAGLLTTVNTEFDRVAMHGTRRTVLEAQAAAAGVPLWVVPLPWPCSNEIYDRLMFDAMRRAIDEGVEAIAFGDLFLRDIRAYREKQLKRIGIRPVFPLWGIPTDRLASEMIDHGLCARVVCIDKKKLPDSFSGRNFDKSLLRDLPHSIDPCGERGEFHTCVYAGPMFSQPIDLDSGETVTRDGFIYADFSVASAEIRKP
jgi:uncharacterized protein (TIGR00290 family)